MPLNLFVSSVESNAGCLADTTAGATGFVVVVVLLLPEHPFLASTATAAIRTYSFY